MREDYSADGNCWDYFPHDHARSRAYRWGEDGLLGISDRECRLCFALALWNGRDPILKERLFGLTGPEGNHGEDVKELYYYLDSTPDAFVHARRCTSTRRRAFPYARWCRRTGGAARPSREFELADTGVFDEQPLLRRVRRVRQGGARRHPDPHHGRQPRARGRAAARAAHAVVPQHLVLGPHGRGLRPTARSMASIGDGTVLARPPGAGRVRAGARTAAADGRPPSCCSPRTRPTTSGCSASPNATPYVKDAFHDYVVDGRHDAVNPGRDGTKAAAAIRLDVPAGGERRVAPAPDRPRTRRPARPRRSPDFDDLSPRAAARPTRSTRAAAAGSHAEDEARRAPGLRGLLWTKQFYHYVVEDWLEGDPAQPPPPPERRDGRNGDWRHLYNRDVISMPDKWEYPWFAAWDLAFHMIPLARIDPQFAKEQLLLLLREWYMHPNGQLPAYEFAFGDVNPPVHAWAAGASTRSTGARRASATARSWSASSRSCCSTSPGGSTARTPRARTSSPAASWASTTSACSTARSPLPDRRAPGAGRRHRVDGVLLRHHAVDGAGAGRATIRPTRTWPRSSSSTSSAIADAMNTLGGTGLWDEQDGFYYDQLHVDGRTRRCGCARWWA